MKPLGHYDHDSAGLVHKRDFDHVLGVLRAQRGTAWEFRGAQSFVALGFPGDRGKARYTMTAVFRLR